MEKVSSCVHLLTDLFRALKDGKTEELEKIAAQIGQEEHAADIIKNDIRNHLPKSLFLAMDRGSLLDLLSIQDDIADKAEDIAVLTTLVPLSLPLHFHEDFEIFLKKNIETFDGANNIIHELHELLESSFGGIEAKKVRLMADAIGAKEHEVDVIQTKILKKFFSSSEEFTLSTFHIWQKIFELVGDLSNLSERLANKLITTLEIK